MRLLIYLSLACSAFFVFQAWAQPKLSPVVLELFTSQSCSSCPPADRLLSELSQANNVIALSCNVTYWNHLHWKDTLSQDFCTRKQREYAAARGTGRVFTPELLINGAKSTVGSRWGDVQQGLHEQTQNLHPIVVQSDAKNITFEFPITVQATDAVIELIGYGANHTKKIPSGENTGRTITYTNPVNFIGQITNKDSDLVITYPRDKLPVETIGVAVLVHENSASGALVAAGQTDL